MRPQHGHVSLNFLGKQRFRLYIVPFFMLCINCMSSLCYIKKMWETREERKREGKNRASIALPNQSSLLFLG